MSDIRIYVGTPGNKYEIAHLEYLTYGKNGLSPNAFDNYIFNDSYLVYVAGINVNNIVGYIVVKKLKSAYLIKHLTVDAEYHNKKIGTMLIRKIKKCLNSERPRIIMLVRDTNTVAHLFLKYNDFVAESVIKPNKYDKGERDLYRFTYEGKF